jgi:hypothetical protein
MEFGQDTRLRDPSCISQNMLLTFPAMLSFDRSPSPCTAAIVNATALLPVAVLTVLLLVVLISGGGG